MKDYERKAKVNVKNKLKLKWQNNIKTFDEIVIIIRAKLFPMNYLISKFLSLVTMVIFYLFIYFLNRYKINEF